VRKSDAWLLRGLQESHQNRKPERVNVVHLQVTTPKKNAPHEHMAAATNAAAGMTNTPSRGLDAGEDLFTASGKLR